MEPWDERLASIDRETAAARAAAHFGACDKPELVGVGANLVFRFRAEGGLTGYLRLIHAALRDREEVAASCAYQQHMHAGGAPVAALIRSRSGRFVETFSVADEPVVAHAVAAVPGRAVEAVGHEYRAFGRALGALHTAATSFAPAPGSFRRDWTEEWSYVTALPADDAPAQAEAARLEAWLATLPREPRCLGLTHADCNRTNALFTAGRVHIIDFDEPTWHWFAADVARPFRELTPEHPAHAECREALLAGYREQRPFGPELEATLPGFVRMKNLEMYAWLCGRGNWAGDELPGGRNRSATLAAIRATFRDD